MQKWIKNLASFYYLQSAIEAKSNGKKIVIWNIRGKRTRCNPHVEIIAVKVNRLYKYNVWCQDDSALDDAFQITLRDACYNHMFFFISSFYNSKCRKCENHFVTLQLFAREWQRAWQEYYYEFRFFPLFINDLFIVYWLLCAFLKRSWFSHRMNQSWWRQLHYFIENNEQRCE